MGLLTTVKPPALRVRYDLSVRENLIFSGRYYGMAPDVIQARAEQLMHTFELTDYAETSPGNLSGGYQRRLLLARTLIHSPELILLDEPTVGLDPHVRKELLQAIKQLKTEQVAVLITTHYLDEIEELVDRVYVLDEGHMVVSGTIGELNKHYGTTTLEELFFAATSKTIKPTESI